MALGPKLDLRQTTSLVMTPQLQQAIALLQYSNLEVATFIEQELERNPLLERADQTSTEASTDTPRTENSDDGWAEPGFEPAEAYDATHSSDGGDASTRRAESAVEQTVRREVSLREHLTAQLNVDIADAGQRVIGVYLIEQLNEAGHLTGDLAEMAATLGCTVGDIEAVLDQLQRFDPPGIFARSLRECLALQLRDRNRLDPAMEKLLDNLELLAGRDRRALLKCCAVSGEDLADMVAEIRALDPKPALAFDTAIAQPIIPDVLMRASAEGGWIIELNSETLPRVLVNNVYATSVRGTSREDRDYVSKHLQSANWLVRALDQRAHTILKVSQEIVRRQQGFFTHGVAHLKPLTLRDIAEAVEMHESTISRVSTNKYMATPRGIYELKYFFSNALGDASGPSSEAVRFHIRRLIEAETAKAVLSDDQLVELLRADGIVIARRTIAKYRESLNIPSSIQRRRDKSATL